MLLFWRVASEWGGSASISVHQLPAQHLGSRGPVTLPLRWSIRPYAGWSSAELSRFFSQVSWSPVVAHSEKHAPVFWGSGALLLRSRLLNLASWKEGFAPCRSYPMAASALFLTIYASPPACPMLALLSHCLRISQPLVSALCRCQFGAKWILKRMAAVILWKSL